MSNLTYEKAGVSIKGGDHWVETIKEILKQHKSDPRVVSGIGGFSGLMRLNGDQLIAGCCDGVGTKVEIARATGIYDGLGQDLVAMNVNDLVTGGAKPLFFLDYIACGSLDEKMMSAVVKSVVESCEYCGCVLLGGETAEMPGVYGKESFDLAGFAVGTCRESEIIDGSAVREGDVLIGLHSSGIHSNGYSLVRKLVFEKAGLQVSDYREELGETVGEALLRPTRIYANACSAVLPGHEVKGIVHITGGGFYENVPRILPAGTAAQFARGTWDIPPVFPFLQEIGSIEEKEMFSTFNMGIGMMMIASAEEAEGICSDLAAAGEKVCRIGEIVSSEGERVIIR